MQLFLFKISSAFHPERMPSFSISFSFVLFFVWLPYFSFTKISAQINHTCFVVTFVSTSGCNFLCLCQCETIISVSSRFLVLCCSKEPTPQKRDTVQDENLSHAPVELKKLRSYEEMVVENTGTPRPVKRSVWERDDDLPSSLPKRVCQESPPKVKIVAFSFLQR